MNTTYDFDSPASLFAQCGEALLGERFKAPLAELLGVRVDTVDAMSKGRSRIPPGIWREIAVLLNDRGHKIPALQAAALDFSLTPSVGIERAGVAGERLTHPASTSISKIEAAESEIVTAVRLFFDGADAVPVYVLASAAREITTTLCIKRGIRSFLEDVREQHPHLSMDALYRMASQHARFSKHADRDPAALLVGFSDQDAETTLFVAVHDFGRLAGGKSIEAQVFEAWYLTLHLTDEVPATLLELLPNLPSEPRARQISMGKELLTWARQRPEFAMAYKTR